MAGYRRSDSPPPVFPASVGYRQGSEFHCFEGGPASHWREGQSTREISGARGTRRLLKISKWVAVLVFLTGTANRGTAGDCDPSTSIWWDSSSAVAGSLTDYRSPVVSWAGESSVIGSLDRVTIEDSSPGGAWSNRSVPCRQVYVLDDGTVVRYCPGYARTTGGDPMPPNIHAHHIPIIRHVAAVGGWRHRIRLRAGNAAGDSAPSEHVEVCWPCVWEVPTWLSHAERRQSYEYAHAACGG